MTVNYQKSFLSNLFDPCDKIPDFQIDDETREALCFHEDLIVGMKGEFISDSKPVGGYSISLESIGAEGREFMAQVLSSLTVNDSMAGSKVLSSLTAKLHCLEEKRTEYIHCNDGLSEKILFIGLEDDLYHLQTEDLCPCDKSITYKDLLLCTNDGIISEGANVLLMRYLAMKNFHGKLSFQSIMIGGQLTTCNYRCSEARRMKLNDYIVDVYTIERRMQEECGLVHNARTQMTRNGDILRHDWLEVPYLLQINPLLDPNKIDHKKPKISAPLSSRWNSDGQMISMYLDKKTCKMFQQTEYLTDHPEIKQLISDYTQTLLAGNHLATTAAFLPMKPINVLSFTIQHFAAFAEHPDPSEICTSDESNMAIMSQLSKHKSKRVCSICGICFDCLMSEQPLFDCECDQAARYPPPEPESSVFSLCSVFSRCPSDAACVGKLSADSGTTATCSDNSKPHKSRGKKYSRCSLSPECEKMCDGCRHLGEPCLVHKVCPECLGCHGTGTTATYLSDSKPRESQGKKYSHCSLSTECEKTCDGCRHLGEACLVHKVCPECPGCHGTGTTATYLNDSKPRESQGKKYSHCSLSTECEKTCNGCRHLGEPCLVHKACPECPGCHGSSMTMTYLDDSKTCKNQGKKYSRCSLSPECEKMCDGCSHHREPCLVHKACPECPGCHKVCSEFEVCPNCKKCNVEILADIAFGTCERSRANSTRNDTNLANDE